MMRAVLLTTDQPNETALAWRLAGACHLVGIVCSRNAARTRREPWAARLLRRIEGRLAGRPFIRAWQALQRRYRQRYPLWPRAPRISVDHINHDATARFLGELAPDLVLVSGTNLLGKPLIELAGRRRGILSLHTGLSPYMKGGPNCTNWCLAEGAFHLIGNTVMWLDAGVDSGPIAASERAPLTGRETLESLHWAVMEHAHALYVRVLRAVSAGAAVSRVPQEALGSGPTFRNRDWNAAAMRRASRNFVHHYSPAAFTPDALAACADVKLVSLPDTEVSDTFCAGTGVKSV